MNTPTLFPMRDIHTDLKHRVRVETNYEVVSRYTENMQTRDDLRKFPPVDLYFDGARHWLGDGYHRIVAADLAGHTHVWAIIHQGNRDDAFWAAMAANGKHGLPLTTTDRRHVIETAIKTWPDRSNYMIAEAIGVSETTVRRIRKVMIEDAELTASDKVLGKDGRMYTSTRPRPFSSRQTISTEKESDDLPITSPWDDPRVTLKHLSVSDPQPLVNELFEQFSPAYREKLILGIFDETVRLSGNDAAWPVLKSLITHLYFRD